MYPIRKITSVLRVLDRYSGLRMDVGSNFITLTEPYRNFHMGTIAYDDATEFVEVEINMTVCDRRTGQPVRTAADHMRSNEWRLNHTISIPQNESNPFLKAAVRGAEKTAAALESKRLSERVDKHIADSKNEQSLSADYCSYCYESGGIHNENCTQKGS